MMDIKNIPGKLKTTCSFCVWKFEKRNGQKTKMPFNPATGERAKINDLRTFSDFKNTLVTYAMGGYDGIGIAVGNGIGAFDIDHCIREDGTLNDTADTVLSIFPTCEQVSNGHPDKICDQIADAIVTDILQHDRNARVAIECLLKKSQLFIAGEVTTDYRPNYNQIVHDVFNRIGAEKLGWNLTELLRIGILVDKQSPDIALGVDKGGAGDQGIMYGYATNETAEQMPIPYMVATKFLQLLKNHPSKMFRADAKAQISYDYDTGRITTFLCSVQHSPDVEVGDFRHIIESMMVLAACEYGLDGDFTKLVNPTGRFVLGGSYADCGVTGRKLACDTYGGIGRMGGGALSGKDPTKVDRSAAYMARKIAKDIVQAGYADKCEVQLAYAIGVVQPVGVSVECFGTEHQSLDFIEAYVHDSYDLTPQGIIKRLGLLDVDYNKVSAYGHFGKAGLPWEE